MQNEMFGDAPSPVVKLKALFSSATDEWPTDQAVFDELSELFGPFNLDAAATKENAKCAHFFTVEDNALVRPWVTVDGMCANVWCNPPYSDCNGFVAKAIGERERGTTTTLLLPSRTDTQWFHDVLHLVAYDQAKVYFVRGRLKFGGAKTGAPFPSVVVRIYP